VSSQGVDKRGRFWFECHPTTELSELSTCKSKGLTCITDHVIDKLDLIALSIWYLDDGTFGGSYKKWGRGKSTIYCKNLPLVEKIKIAKAIKDKFKLDCSVVKSGLIFSGENNYKFHSTIAPFVPKCMEYKIHPKLRQLCGGFDYSDNYDVRDVLIEVPILEIRDGKPKRSPFKYDIEVEHNHNYFVSDVLVHNSPETTPGGNAMKFTASLRIDVRKGPVMKNGDSIIGHVMRATIKKSKISASFGRKVEIPLYYGVGFDYTRELLEVAVGLGIAEKKGSWYNYGNVKLGQGIENAKQFLEDNMEVYEQIESKVKEEAEE
jgi:recombination protein RecA